MARECVIEVKIKNEEIDIRYSFPQVHDEFLNEYLGKMFHYGFLCISEILPKRGVEEVKVYWEKEKDYPIEVEIKGTDKDAMEKWRAVMEGLGFILVEGYYTVWRINEKMIEVLEEEIKMIDREIEEGKKRIKELNDMIMLLEARERRKASREDA